MCWQVSTITATRPSRQPLKRPKVKELLWPLLNPWPLVLLLVLLLFLPPTPSGLSTWVWMHSNYHILQFFILWTLTFLFPCVCLDSLDCKKGWPQWQVRWWFLQDCPQDVEWGRPSELLCWCSCCFGIGYQPYHPVHCVWTAQELYC